MVSYRAFPLLFWMVCTGIAHPELPTPLYYPYRSETSIALPDILLGIWESRLRESIASEYLIYRVPRERSRTTKL